MIKIIKDENKIDILQDLIDFITNDERLLSLIGSKQYNVQLYPYSSNSKDLNLSDSKDLNDQAIFKDFNLIYIDGEILFYSSEYSTYCIKDNVANYFFDLLLNNYETITCQLLYYIDTIQFPICLVDRSTYSYHNVITNFDIYNFAANKTLKFF